MYTEQIAEFTENKRGDASFFLFFLDYYGDL